LHISYSVVLYSLFDCSETSAVVKAHIDTGFCQTLTCSTQFSLAFTVHSAWSPPIQALKTMMAQKEDLKITIVWVVRFFNPLLPLSLSTCFLERIWNIR